MLMGESLVFYIGSQYQNTATTWGASVMRVDFNTGSTPQYNWIYH